MSAEDLVKGILEHIEPDQQVVVHCAGRTRGIIGAQALIDAGVSNRVVSLENGTMAWEFSDLELELGANRPLPDPGAEGLRRSAAAVERRQPAFLALHAEALGRGRLRVRPNALGDAHYFGSFFGHHQYAGDSATVRASSTYSLNVTIFFHLPALLTLVGRPSSA